jgi:hypothetical protein
MHRFLALVVISLSSWVQAFDGQPLRYEVDWGPLTLADAEVRLLDSDTVRSVNVTLASRGAGAWFSSFQSDLEILDMRDGTQLLNGTSRWDEGFSQITVSWLPSEAEPLVDYFRSKPRSYEVTPIPPESIGDTVDPFAPVFEVAKRLDATGRCEGEYRIFDGIRRYDLVIVDGGDVELTADSELEFSGLAHRCDIQVQRIGGFSAKRGMFRFGESEITRTLLFGQVGTHWIPVRFEIGSPIGTAVARLVRDDTSVATRTQ